MEAGVTHTRTFSKSPKFGISDFEDICFLVGYTQFLMTFSKFLLKDDSECYLEYFLRYSWVDKHVDPKKFWFGLGFVFWFANQLLISKKANLKCI